jgi:ABC-type molybdate transport system substrate-binding protein
VCRWPLEIPDTSVLHQGAVILSRASDEDAALLFMNFLRSERARDLISSHGYEVPSH